MADSSKPKDTPTASNRPPEKDSTSKSEVNKETEKRRDRIWRDLHYWGKLRPEDVEAEGTEEVRQLDALAKERKEEQERLRAALLNRHDNTEKPTQQSPIDTPTPEKWLPKQSSEKPEEPKQQLPTQPPTPDRWLPKESRDKPSHTPTLAEFKTEQQKLKEFNERQKEIRKHVEEARQFRDSINKSTAKSSSTKEPKAESHPVNMYDIANAFYLLGEWAKRFTMPRPDQQQKTQSPTEPSQIPSSIKSPPTTEEVKPHTTAKRPEAKPRLEVPNAQIVRNPITGRPQIQILSDNTERKAKSWIHNIPVWKELGPWLKWASASFGIAATMTQINEYFLAELGLLASGICCIAQIYVWTTPKARLLPKIVLASLSVVLMVVAGLTVYVIKGEKAWSNWMPAKPLIGKVRVEGGETVTARIKTWGTSGERDVFAVVNSAELSPLADDYRLLMICRVQDNKLDAKDDLRIDKSGMFSISGTDQRLEVALSQDAMRRLVPEGWVNIYVLLVPAKINSKELRTVKEFTQSGAYVLGNPSMLVHATIENKSGRLVGN